MGEAHDYPATAGPGGMRPALNAPPGRIWHPPVAEAGRSARRAAIMPRAEVVTGLVLLVQEGRIRLLTEEGRGRVFLLSAEASAEPQDLAALPGRRVRLRYHAAPRLMAGTVTAIEVLP
jgi:hypothetical protein